MIFEGIIAIYNQFFPASAQYCKVFYMSIGLYNCPTEIFLGRENASRQWKTNY